MMHVVWIDANNTDSKLINKAGRINHCCAPNCVTHGQHGQFSHYEPRAGVVAKRALKKGEEVTIDYRWQSVDGNR